MSEAPQVKTLSWRINLLWTSAGTIVYAASNWAVLCIVAKLGTPEMVGEYALGLAVTAPVLMMAQMNLRAVLATDARGEHCFADYWRLRVNGTLLGMAMIIGLAAMGHAFSTAAVIVAVGMSQAVEGISDIYYGLMQRHERMDRITVSMLWKGATSLIAMAAGLWATGSALWGVVAMFAVRLAVLVFYDAGPGSRDFVATEPRIASTRRESFQRQFSLLWLAAPLAVVMLLNSLCSNMPRYFMEHYMGTRELGNLRGGRIAGIGGKHAGERSGAGSDAAPGEAAGVGRPRKVHELQLAADGIRRGAGRVRGGVRSSAGSVDHAADVQAGVRAAQRTAGGADDRGRRRLRDVDAGLRGDRRTVVPAAGAGVRGGYARGVRGMRVAGAGARLAGRGLGDGHGVRGATGGIDCDLREGHLGSKAASCSRARAGGQCLGAHKRRA